MSKTSLGLYSLTLTIVQGTIDAGAGLRMIWFKRKNKGRGKEVQLEDLRGWHNLLLHFFWISLMGFYSLLLGISWIQSIRSGPELDLEMALYFLKTILYTLITGNYLGICSERRRCAVFVASIRDIQKELEGFLGMRMRNWWETMVTAFPMIGGFFYAVEFPIFMLIFFLLKPQSPGNVYAYLPAGTQDSLITKVICAFLEVTGMLTVCLLGLILIILTWSYFMSTLIWMPHIRFVNQRNMSSAASAKDLQSEMSRWRNAFRRTLCIFTQMRLLGGFMDGYLFHMVSFNLFFFSGVTTLFLYGAVAAYGKLPFQVYVIFPSFTVFCFFFIIVTYLQFGLLYKNSRELFYGWGFQLKGTVVGLSAKAGAGSVPVNRGLFAEFEKNLRAMRGFGIRLPAGICKVSTPLRLTENIFTFFILLIHLDLHG